jgi:hypothetical protein
MRLWLEQRGRGRPRCAPRRESSREARCKPGLLLFGTSKSYEGFVSQPMIPGPARTGLVVGAPVGVSLTCRGFLLNVTCELVAVSWFSGIG